MIHATKRPGYQYRSDARNGEESRPEQHPPDATPEGALPAPILHAVAGVIVSDHVLVGVIILADDGHLLHVKPRPLQFLHCFLCLGVRFVNGYNRVRFRHDLSSFLSRLCSALRRILDQMCCLLFHTLGLLSEEHNNRLSHTKEHPYGPRRQMEKDAASRTSSTCPQSCLWEGISGERQRAGSAAWAIAHGVVRQGRPAVMLIPRAPNFRVGRVFSRSAKDPGGHRAERIRSSSIQDRAREHRDSPKSCGKTRSLCQEALSPRSARDRRPLDNHRKRAKAVLRSRGDHGARMPTTQYAQRRRHARGDQDLTMADAEDCAPPGRRAAVQKNQDIPKTSGPRTITPSPPFRDQ